ncbi:MAG TPA: tetratricopeptide repeat protein [Candidatus Nanoarchaeia archaeon]|nr:tetratricopeptide repeat protein [Candidatus Nanoarchaeia archaeon]
MARNALFEQGSRLYKKAKYSEALECFGRLADLDPNDPRVHNFIGVILLCTGQFQKALFHFSHAEDLLTVAYYDEKRKNDLRLIFGFNRAFAYHNLGEYKKSNEIFIELLPQVIEVE